MLSKRYTTFVLAGAAAAGLAAAAQASLTYDLVATGIKKSGTTTVVTPADGKNITAAVGDIVRLRLYATVTGTDANKAQTFQAASGSLVSGLAGTSAGNFQTVRVSTNATNTGTVAHVSNPWKGNSWSTGLAQDLDLDGDLDLGSNADAASDNFIAYRAGDLKGPKSNNAAGQSDFTDPSTAPTTTGASTKYVLSAQVDWVVTGSGTPASLNWKLRSGQSAVWFEDATETATDVNGDGSVIQYTYSGGTTGTVQLVGAPVIVTTGIPEPTMLGAVGLAGLGMLARRRKA
jgi:hypothetical protein